MNIGAGYHQCWNKLSIYRGQVVQEQCTPTMPLSAILIISCSFEGGNNNNAGRRRHINRKSPTKSNKSQRSHSADRILDEKKRKMPRFFKSLMRKGWCLNCCDRLLILKNACSTLPCPQSEVNDNWKYTAKLKSASSQELVWVTWNYLGHLAAACPPHIA